MWDFAEHLGERRAHLESVRSTAEIIAALTTRVAIVCGHTRTCDLDSRYCRATYCLSVDPPVFDLFFNAQHGYRGAYYRSWHEGLRANADFLRALLPALVPYEILDRECDIDVRQSLTAISAKLWLAEVGKHLCQRCEGEWKPPGDDLPDIRNGRWEHAEGPYGRYGRKAPYLRKVRVFGAFVDQQGNELIPWDKRVRAEDIEKRGWS